jgi:hypothetical protein
MVVETCFQRAIGESEGSIVGAGVEFETLYGTIAETYAKA